MWSTLLLKGVIQLNLSFLALICEEFEGSSETETEMSDVFPHSNNKTWTLILTTTVTYFPSVKMLCTIAQITFFFFAAALSL